MSTKGIATDYRSTLNLPQTGFAMKADLAQREPARVAWWKEQRVYERRLERNAGAQPWILHDGPPYANGEVHMGTFLNRVLKDVFFKVHLLRGRYARFVPGWIFLTIWAGTRCWRRGWSPFCAATRAMRGWGCRQFTANAAWRTSLAP